MMSHASPKPRSFEPRGAGRVDGTISSGALIGFSIGMRRVAVATGADLAVEAAEELLEKTRQSAALRLARFLVLAREPRDLDHSPLAFVRKVPVKGVVRAPERGERAVERLDFGRSEIVDVVDAVQEPEAAVAGVGPGLVEIEERRRHFRLAVGVDRAMPLVE